MKWVMFLAITAGVIVSGELKKVCRVATATGSRFLDKRCEIELDAETTVYGLKQRLSKVFPGQPPVAIQRLFYGTRFLSDDEETLSQVVAEEEEGQIDNTQLSFVLDSLPPLIAGQHRTPDLTEDRIRALAAETVALERAWRLIRSWRTTSENEELQTAEIANEIAIIESALLDDALASPLEKKRTTIVPGYTKTGLDDAIIDWDAMNRNAIKPSVFFYVDWRDTIKITLGLMAAAKFGTQDPSRAVFFYAMIPLVIAFQTRPARLLLKFLWYMIPRGPQNKHAFWNVLLSGPQQSILSIDEDDYNDGSSDISSSLSTDDTGEREGEIEDDDMEEEYEEEDDEEDDIDN